MQENFSRDLQQEEIVIEFLKNTFFSFLEMYENAFVEIVKDEERQMHGIDAIAMYLFNKDKDTEFYDVKAQMNKYITNPTNTFCLELGYEKFGEPKTGWFLKDGLKTSHYLFMWIFKSDYEEKGNNRLLKKWLDIKEAEIMVVDKSKLVQSLNDVGLTKECLMDIKNTMMEGYKSNKMERVYFDLDKKELVENKGNTFTITKSNFLPEKPINLVIPKSFYKKICGYNLKLFFSSTDHSCGICGL
jgi:hypothetical protein